MIRPPRFIPDHVDAGMRRIRQRASRLPSQAPSRTSKADDARSQRIHTLLAALTAPESTHDSTAHDTPEAQHPFGEPYRLTDLPLPRPAIGYGVQQLGSDRLLDQHTLTLQAMRHPGLHAVFADFASAERTARQWLDTAPAAQSLPLSIVPLGWDADMQRPILIWGMLSAEPEAELDAARATLRQLLHSALADQANPPESPRTSKSPSLAANLR